LKFAGSECLDVFTARLSTASKNPRSCQQGELTWNLFSYSAHFIVR